MARIQHVIVSSRTRTVESEHLRPTNIIRALFDRDDYHQYYYVESPDDVKVVSIVDYEEEHAD